MKLHRAHRRPDWTRVSKRARNLWQRLAVSTKGVVTPANIATIAGFVIVLLGLEELLQRHYWAAIIAMTLGRLLDIADGWLAELTGTKSPLGELLDASIDKIGTALTILVFYSTRVAPWWILLALLLPPLVIAIISLLAFFRRKRLHPSRAGKFSMAAAWCSLIGLVLARAVQASQFNLITIIVDALAVLSIILGIYATLGYALRWD